MRTLRTFVTKEPDFAHKPWWIIHYKCHSVSKSTNAVLSNWARLCSTVVCNILGTPWHMPQLLLVSSWKSNIALTLETIQFKCLLAAGFLFTKMPWLNLLRGGQMFAYCHSRCVYAVDIFQRVQKCQFYTGQDTISYGLVQALGEVKR